MHHVGTDEQLFVDNLLIDSVQSVTRRVAQPTKSDANPLLLKDKPWETILYLTCNTWNVHRHNGGFRCWYEDWDIDFEMRRKIATAETSFQGEKNRIKSWLHPAVSAIRTLYAESPDGLVWNKPADDYPLGVPGTNIVAGNEQYGNVHAPCIFLDPKEQNPDKRYKMIFTRYNRDETTSHGTISLAYSADGRNWYPCEENPVFGESGSRLGDVWTMFYDTIEDRYVLPTRHIKMHAHRSADRKPHTPRLPGFFGPYYPFDDSRMNKRRVSISFSNDLLHWDEPKEIVIPDDNIDNLDDCYYGMQITQVGSQYLGFLHRLRHVEDTMDVFLVHSRNLIDWQHVIPRVPFISLGGAGAWDQGMVTMPNPPVQHGDETWFFYGGSRNHHDWWVEGLSKKEELDVPEAWNHNLVSFGLGLATTKRNRYVALATGPRPGMVVTEELVLDGPDLLINARCGKGGSVRVGLAGVQGYEVSDCDEFDGDDTDHRVTWKGRSLPPGSGAVRLYFQMQNAELFGFRVAGATE